MGGKMHSTSGDVFVCVNSWAHRWEPRTKTVAAVSFVIGIITLQSLHLLLTAFSLTLLAALSTGLRPQAIMRRMLWTAPFLLLMALPLVLGGGFPIATERGLTASLLIFKALTSILVMAILLGTQSVQQYFCGLAHMRLPALLVAVLYLAYRYVFLFRDQVATMQRALAARGFQPGLKKSSFKVFGEMAGGLLVKAVDRSDAVYRAMSARAFAGRLHTGRPLPVTKRDQVKCGLVLMFTAIIMLAEWRWLR